MPDTIKLIDHPHDLERGSILRCPARWPYEDYVDFMLIEYLWNGQHQYALMVVSGHKAGLIFVVFPIEAINQPGSGIDIEWLKTHWSTWGYIDCPLQEAHLIFKPAPTSLHD